MNASSSEPLSKARTAIVTWQAKLLDVSKGNRLLRFRQTRLSTVPIDEPDLATLFEWFVLGERSIPVISDARDEEQTREMLWDEVPEPEAGALKHSPMRGILSPYPPKQLQAALYNLRQKAQSSIEERGVNILHVALGFLVWNDAQDKDLESHAPLILAPIVIERIGLSKYTVKALDEDAVLNPTLAYKLHLDHGLDLPELPDDWEGRCFCSYLDSIQRQVDQLPGATIDQATFIGLFSFLKIPMYEDLTRNTDALLGHPLVARLAGIPAPMPSGLGLADEATPLDEIIDPKAVLQVLDADSSQQEALLAIRNGSHLVLQGPPGTGKSQTITNLIAEALSTGKKVMFVSEKEAALTIVKRHLDRCGLGDACLELHGHQADKKKVLGELERTLYAPRLSAPSTAEPKFAELVSERNALNRYVDALHTPRYAAGLTAFEVYGRLARLRSATKLDFTLGSAVDLTANDLQQRQTCLDVLTVHDQVIDHLADHPWLGLRARPPSPAFENELRKHLQSLRQIGQDLELGLSEARLATGLTWTDNLAQLEQATRLFAKYRCQILALPGSEWHQRFNDRYSPKHRVVQLGYWRDANRLRSLCRSAWTWHYPTIVADLADLQQVQAWLVPERRPSPDDSILVPHAKRLGELAAQARAELDYFREQMDESGAFQKLDLASNLLRVVPWCDSHLDSLPRVGEYLAFAHDRDAALSAGLGSFVEAATATSTPAREWPNAYLRAYYEAWLGTAVQDASELGYFGRAAHEKHILRFCELDREQLKLAAQLIMAKVSQDRPEPNDFTANIRSAEITVLLRELKKQRKIKPLRKLFREAPHVIQALKPCLMMSPLSVSQFIEPGSFQFDLVVFDEASQVKVEDAIGSIYRGHQLVVAGDSRQLPPTRFFDVMTTDEEWDEDTEDASDVYESILDALTPILPEKMLHWHYRSRHETLIALSNKEFYRGKLFTFPSPAETGSERAIDFVYVPDGLYERGGGRRNMVEARRVVDLIVRHAQEHSDWSLAVVTFSEAQREAVEHEVEARLTTQLGLKRFIDDEHNRGEPFRVKNLELIQGDERDVVIFSVGYGKDETGKPSSLNFGPLNKDGGRRRLNVAITRARQHVTVVSSLQPEELERSDNEGVRLLREYMTLARDGLLAWAGMARDAGGSVESPLEADVLAALTEAGLQARPQVGVSGYRIDFGIVDPKVPGHYCLGIECDGATYHSAKTARDRDRLRQQVLEGLGWRIHRIWSREWYADPNREVRRVVELVQQYAGKAPVFQSPKPTSVEPTKPSEVSIARSTGDSVPGPVQGRADSQRLPLKVEAYYQLFDGKMRSSLGASPRVIAEDVSAIVNVESPVHVETVMRRIADRWGHKIGKNIRQELLNGIDEASRRGLVTITQGKEFLWSKPARPVVVRVPGPGDEPRPMEYTCPEEIEAGIMLCLERAGGGVSRADLATMIARLFGYHKTTTGIAAPIYVVIDSMLQRGTLTGSDDMIRVGARKAANGR